MSLGISTAAKTGTLPLRTPEGIVFSLPLAGPASRFLALSIDVACITAASEALDRVFGALKVVGVGQALFAIAYFAPQLIRARLAFCGT